MGDGKNNNIIMFCFGAGNKGFSTCCSHNVAIYVYQCTGMAMGNQPYYVCIGMIGQPVTIKAAMWAEPSSWAELIRSLSCF